MAREMCLCLGCGSWFFPRPHGPKEPTTCSGRCRVRLHRRRKASAMTRALLEEYQTPAQDDPGQLHLFDQEGQP